MFSNVLLQSTSQIYFSIYVFLRDGLRNDHSEDFMRLIGTTIQVLLLYYKFKTIIYLHDINHSLHNLLLLELLLN